MRTHEWRTRKADHVYVSLDWEYSCLPTPPSDDKLVGAREIALMRAPRAPPELRPAAAASDAARMPHPFSFLPSTRPAIHCCPKPLHHTPLSLLLPITDPAHVPSTHPEHTLISTAVQHAPK